MFILLFFVLISIVIIQSNHSNNNNFEFKTIETKCDNFNISGSVAYNSSKSSIYISNVEYCGSVKDIKYKTIECNLYDIDVVYNEYLNSHIKRDSERQRKIDDAFRDISEKGEF
jgi:hypothetical protein